MLRTIKPATGHINPSGFPTDLYAPWKPTGNVLANLATILKNIESLGYTFSPQLIDRLSTLSLPEASLFYSQLSNRLETGSRSSRVRADVSKFPRAGNGDGGSRDIS